MTQYLYLKIVVNSTPTDLNSWHSLKSGWKSKHWRLRTPLGRGSHRGQCRWGPTLAPGCPWAVWSSTVPVIKCLVNSHHLKYNMTICTKKITYGKPLTNCLHSKAKWLHTGLTLFPDSRPFTGWRPSKIWSYLVLSLCCRKMAIVGFKHTRLIYYLVSLLVHMVNWYSGSFLSLPELMTYTCRSQRDGVSDSQG